ncbi:PadR family transcriptional regulator, partial [Streptomyces sp. NPDC054933]
AGGALRVHPASARQRRAVMRGGGGSGDPAGLTPQSPRHREVHAERLARYLAGEQRDFPDSAVLNAGQELQHVVLRGGIAYERMTLAWLDDVLATLRRLGGADPDTH